MSLFDGLLIGGAIVAVIALIVAIKVGRDFVRSFWK
jgi:gas vesicle protein